MAVETGAGGPSLPKAGENEAKTAGLHTILHQVRISTEDRAGIIETTIAHQREVQPRIWVETSRVNSVSNLLLLFLTVKSGVGALGQGVFASFYELAFFFSFKVEVFLGTVCFQNKICKKNC